MFLKLVVSWNQDWEYACAELSGDVFHALTVRSAGIDRAFTLEVSPEDAVVAAFSTPPLLVSSRLLLLHLFEELSE